MKIGIDARMLGKKQATGIGNYIQQITLRILQLDSLNQYYIFVKQENLEFTKNLLSTIKSKNYQVITTNCHWYSLCEQIKFCALLYRYNLDLVHFPQFNVPILYFKKFIVTIHDVTAIKFPGPKMKLLLRATAFKLVFRKAIKNSDKIITVSKYTKQEILKIYPQVENKIFITYLGVEKDFSITTNYGKIKEIKERFGITKPYIFYVGVWRLHKNIHGLIKAFEILKSNYKHDIQLVLGGQKSKDYKEISGLGYEQNKDILETGFIDEADLPHLYQGAELYIVPSFEEGFGINGLEAMLSKTAVIASKTGSLKEIYGDSAYYFNPYKPNDIAYKINQTLINQTFKEELIKKGSQKVKLYDWDKTAKLTLEIYNTLLKKAKR